MPRRRWRRNWLSGWYFHPRSHSVVINCPVLTAIDGTWHPGGGGTVCERGGRKKNWLEKEEVETGWRKQSNQWEDSIDCTKTWTLLRIFPINGKRPRLIRQEPFALSLQISCRLQSQEGTRATLFFLSLHLGAKKSFWSQDALRDDGITRISYFSLCESLATPPAGSSAMNWKGFKTTENCDSKAPPGVTMIHVTVTLST